MISVVLVLRRINKLHRFNDSIDSDPLRPYHQIANVYAGSSDSHSARALYMPVPSPASVPEMGLESSRIFPVLEQETDFTVD